MKRPHALLVLLCALTAAGVWLHTGEMKSLLAAANDLSAKIRIFAAIVETIQRSYVAEVSPEALLDEAIKGMLSGLDPHTTYLPADNFERWNYSFEGFSGIGITYALIRGKVTVLRVLDGGPAQRAGLLPGDRIVEINDIKVNALTHDDVPKKIMGASGSRVTVLLEREGWTAPRRFFLVRDHVLLHSISVGAIIRPGTGYIKIDRFTGRTSAELEHALQQLLAEGATELVLDLRGNSGGYLSAAVEVADKFLTAGKLIVYTKGRSAAAFQEYYATENTDYLTVPLIVLIDHATASAAEIVAGALQDWDRALIVGKSSFGKGLVQSQYRFADGSALLMTTAKYYTPSGRLIQRSYTDKTKDEYYSEAYNDSLFSRHTPDDRPRFHTASRRTVYGGGGITPDIWVANQETRLDEDLRRLYFGDQRAFYTYLEDYIRRRPELRQQRHRFPRNFEVSDEMFEDFLRLAMRLQPDLAPLSLRKSREEIKFLIKRDMAYILWGETERLRVNMEQDVLFREALRYFKQAADLLTLRPYMASAQELPKN